jgi:hypothetical protein
MSCYSGQVHRGILVLLGVPGLEPDFQGNSPELRASGKPL